MEKQTLVSALLAAIDSDGRSDYAIAKQAGIDRENINNWRNGGCPGPIPLNAVLCVLGLRLVLGAEKSRRRLEV